DARGVPRAPRAISRLSGGRARPLAMASAAPCGCDRRRARGGAVLGRRRRPHAGRRSPLGRVEHAQLRARADRLAQRAEPRAARTALVRGGGAAPPWWAAGAAVRGPAPRRSADRGERPAARWVRAVRVVRRGAARAAAPADGPAGEPDRLVSPPGPAQP